MSHHWADVAREHFSMTGDHPMLRMHMQQSIDTASSKGIKPLLLPDYWEDPRTYRPTHEKPLERAEPRVLDPDPLVIWRN